METAVAAVPLTGRPGLHPWQGGIRGFGDAYRVQFARDGVRFLPSLNRAEIEQYLELRPCSVMRGSHNVCEMRLVAPQLEEFAVDYPHTPGIRERYDIDAEHMSLSWVFDQRPAGSGDLIVSYAIGTTFPLPTRNEAGGLDFVREGVGGVSVGGVTGIDADGVTIAGTLDWVDGAIELRLPAQFVDEAAYPMTLDPVFGPELSWNTTNDARSYDTAYDAGTDRFLVVYGAEVASNVFEVRGQYVTSAGALSGSPFTLSVPGCSDARVANLATEGVFGVIWRRGTAIGNVIEFRGLEAASPIFFPTFTIAISTTGELAGHDIGCDTNAPSGSGRGFVIVYDNEQSDEIVGRTVSWSAAGQPVYGAPTTLLSDNPAFNIDYSEPQLSKAGAHVDDLLLVCRQELSTLDNVVIRRISSDTLSTSASTSISGVGPERVDPDVDGYNGKWVVAWSERPDPASAFEIELRNVRFDGASLAAGNAGTLTAFANARKPRVGYAPGRTWVTFSDVTNVPIAGRVRSIDSNTCANCMDGLELVPRDDVIIATTTSGGAPAREWAITAWDIGWVGSPNVFAQVLRNYGSGQAVNIGGACGTGGSNGVSHAPGIGSSGLVCSVSGLPPTALATIFNFAPPQPPLVCGACAWSPFVSTVQPPIVAGEASVQFPIPCQTGLIGAQFETQWTTFDFTQTECPLLPRFVLSDRLQLTIGN